MVKKVRNPGRKAAEALAIQALSFIAGEPERLGQFLAATGIGPDGIRVAAGEPLFLAGVLDHLAANEPLLLTFASESGTDPHDIVRARDVLSGRPWEQQTP